MTIDPDVTPKHGIKTPQTVNDLWQSNERLAKDLAAMVEERDGLAACLRQALRVDPKTKAIKKLKDLLLKVMPGTDTGLCNRCYKLYGDYRNGIHCVGCGSCMEAMDSVCVEPQCELAEAVK